MLTVDAFKRDCFCNQLFIVLNLSRNAFISCHVMLCNFRIIVLLYVYHPLTRMSLQISENLLEFQGSCQLTSSTWAY